MQEYEVRLIFVYHVFADDSIDAVEQAELLFKESENPLVEAETIEEVSAC